MSIQKYKLSALQKDILRLAKQYEKVTIQVVASHYDETHWTIKMNFYRLEKLGLIKRANGRRLEFVAA